ncbi:SPOR domain-containing protein [Marivirga salinae]|uniref:SPOR domain-containing protein n=1 Tax=Marivirga salinarum TaxID=3059078 RepID=A0AA51RAB6_9BACT|nr:SPOR domain-containing protein [Marivirga sp. BDSF4-3]WMN10966.1 SPOR domain-containing protein [Marivirga sp. BDSF4-3]
MAKKDKKDEEYKDENLHNEPEQDDEDFGLPDLDDDSDSDKDSSSTTEESEQETSFDTSETSEEPIASDYEQEDDEYDPDPFGDDEEEEPVSTYTPPKKQSAAPIIITLSIIVILACVLVYFFFLREPEKEPVAQKPVKDTTSYVVEKPVEPEPEVIEPEEPSVGVVNTLNSRTGRSYVVVGSFFDEDLAQDYADKLTKDGTNAYIIPPFGKSKFNRVAIEETESFAAASTRATELSGQFKEQPWPLKY